MLILGIDPGLNYTGWGIIKNDSSSISYVDCNIIKPNAKLDTSRRLFHIYDELKQVFNKYQIDAVSIEETFINKDMKGSLKLGYARGIGLMIPSIYNIPVFEYAPNTVKKTVAGRGHASKDDIKLILSFLMPQIKKINVGNDAIDAIAIAVCHSYHKQH